MRTESLSHTFTARLPLLVPSCRSLISCTCNVTADPLSVTVCVFLSHTLTHKDREQRVTIILWVWDKGRAVQTWCEGPWGEWYGHTHSYNLLAGDAVGQPSSEIRGVYWASLLATHPGLCSGSSVPRVSANLRVFSDATEVCVFGCVHTLTHTVQRMNVYYREDFWVVTTTKLYISGWIKQMLLQLDKTDYRS